MFVIVPETTSYYGIQRQGFNYFKKSLKKSLKRFGSVRKILLICIVFETNQILKNLQL